jgi:hypothetical protein
MTDKEFIEKIQEIAHEYYEDTDHWTSYFMEKIVDVIEVYNRENTFL